MMNAPVRGAAKANCLTDFVAPTETARHSWMRRNFQKFSKKAKKPEISLAGKKFVSPIQLLTVTSAFD